MADGFNMELRGQQEWSWLVALDLFLGGLGGGLFLLYLNFDLPLFVALLSLGLVALGGGVLLSELGQPGRAWRAIVRLRTSWISRGVLFVSLFLVTGSLYIVSTVPAFSWLPWAGDNLAAKILGLVAGSCALLITLYPGFVLAASPAIPFWNTRLLPALFFAHSTLGACGLLLLISSFGSFERSLSQIESLAASLIFANFILILIYLLTMIRLSAASEEAVRLLNHGSLGWTFGIGVYVVGMILPFLLVVWFPSAMAPAGAFILLGGLLFRYCVLKAGVYVPFALVGMDMSRLNRTDADLAREYAAMKAPLLAREDAGRKLGHPQES